MQISNDCLNITLTFFKIVWIISYKTEKSYPIVMNVGRFLLVVYIWILYVL